MLIPVHQLCGTLASGLSSGALLLPLDGNSTGLLDGLLDSGDWTYLQIKQGTTYEIVKVTGIDESSVTIERAIDGTTASTFLLGADVSFVLTTSAIADIILEKQLSSIQIIGAGVIEVTEESPGVFEIYAPPFILEGTGKVIVTGSYEEGYTVSALSPLGCCD